MKKKQKGFIMGLALVIIAALLITIVSVMSYAAYSQTVTIKNDHKKNMKYMAESGVEMAIAKLKNQATTGQNPAPSDISSISSFDLNDVPNSTDSDNVKDNSVYVNCHVDISKSADNNSFIITSAATNAKNTKEKYTVTATIDIGSSFLGNDYINDIGSKTITAITDLDPSAPGYDITSNTFNLSDKLNITGSVFIQGNKVTINPAGGMLVNNIDKTHSGDSAIKLDNGAGSSISNVQDFTNYKWFGDFDSSSIFAGNSFITPLIIKQKKLLDIQSGVQDYPEFFQTPNAIDVHDMVLWKLPPLGNPNIASQNGAYDFTNIKIKNYIINESGVFDDLLEKPIPDPSNGFDDYNALGSDTDDTVATQNDDKIEAKYRNLYKVILVDGDLLWNQPDFFSQSINWVIYCTGKITFSSDFQYTDSNGNTGYLNDNSNCSFIAKSFEFKNTHPGSSFRTNISFCNLKQVQLNEVYDYLKRNLSYYYDGLDVRITGWTEKYDS